MERIYRARQGTDTFYAIERDGVVRRASGDLYAGLTPGEPIADGLKGLSLQPPVMPSKIVCVGLNYKDHAAETGKPLPAEPLIFIKPRTAVIGPGEPIRIPPGVGRVDHEAELGIVIGKRAHRVARAHAWDYILGLICVNDVTARDLQKKESQYTRCKGFDTFAPIGPCVATGLNGSSRAVEGWVNAERRQASTTGHLIFPIEQLVEFVTFVMTLEPGDIISTGTPEGIGPIKAGDSVKVRVEGVGELINPVQDE
ncbi:MAG TPA: fumarylacetoacetate hydrolase family protein [Vicinamibacterales bacterium]|jgi:2-keto-4-pentenoate hydratase/2-oxohepta-3-ene-1,7-dioic acid hydratase in catechol pathway